MLTIRQALALYPDKGVDEIARLTGCEPHSVYSVRSRLKKPKKYAEQHRAAQRRKRRELGMRSIDEIRWPAEHVAILRRDWLTNTASTIGAKIGRSKSAVIGMANRMKLPAKVQNAGLKQYFNDYRKTMKQIEARNA
jgi:hypothetical protein